MKNIKKIIKEEIDNFDWVEDSMKDIDESESMLHIGAFFKIHKFGKHDGSVTIKIVDKDVTQGTIRVDVIETSGVVPLEVGDRFNLAIEKLLKDKLIGNYWEYLPDYEG